MVNLGYGNVSDGAQASKDYADPYRDVVRRSDVGVLEEAKTPAERRDLENQLTGE